MKFIRRIWQFIYAQHIWLSGGKEYNALPPTLRAAITRQQDESERLIGYIQLAILSAFAGLYFAAPKTIPTGAAFEPVPMFLGAYFAFTCLRLWWAHKTSMPFWFLVASILVDMALLFGLIWSFHLQYAQPAAFYLKAPTLLYIFIFIALRGLRFEPGFVLLAGLIGAAGWLGLVAFAVVDSGTAVVTQNYVQYLTANRVLIGGEVDKIISILVVTVILTAAVARARRRLIQSVVEGSAAANLSKFVPGGMARSVAVAEGSLLDAQPQTREATILFADLVSFSGLSESLGASEKVFATMREYFKEIIAAPIKRGGGEFCFFEGDAVMVSFNLPTAHAAHATAAITAALEIQQLLSRHEFAAGLKLQARIGVNTGVVTGGFIGIPDSFTTYTVYGDGVNIAARLEQLNKTKGTSILVSARSMELSDAQKFTFTPQGGEILRGRQSAIQVFAPAFKS